MLGRENDGWIRFHCNVCNAKRTSEEGTVSGRFEICEICLATIGAALQNEAGGPVKTARKEKPDFDGHREALKIVGRIENVMMHHKPTNANIREWHRFHSRLSSALLRLMSDIYSIIVTGEKMVGETVSDELEK